MKINSFNPNSPPLDGDGLPPPLMTSEEGSFARSTIVERKPFLIRQVQENNAYPTEIIAALEQYRIEIAGQPMHFLQEDAPDVDDWNRALAFLGGAPWLDAPWYFAEAFFYRRLLEAVCYFQPGAWQGINPFGVQKRAQIEQDCAQFAHLWKSITENAPEGRFDILLHSALWGNRNDLSNITIQVPAASGAATEEERRWILIDHTPQIRSILSAGVRRLDFICDNVGFDLLFDLALADHVLEYGWVQRVILHLKNQPFFVSDVMPQDVGETLAILLAADSRAASKLAQRLECHLADSRLVLKTDPFWTGWRMYRQMPSHLRDEFVESDLTLIKGDVNYRRLLDDRHWDATTPLEIAAASFPRPFAVLRTLKGELIVGLQPGQAEWLSSFEPDWMINGKRGLIHLTS